MPLFQSDNGKIKRIKSTDFAKELEIQKMIENNLETIFNCRFVSTEFSTGDIHSGRIDTLALSEDNASGKSPEKLFKMEGHVFGIKD